MYAQTSQNVRHTAADVASTTPGRATRQTRPFAQRSLIRSSEQSRPVRITVLAIRVLVATWLSVLTAILLSHGQAWAYSLVLVAAGVLAYGLWVFTTAKKGWPVAGA